MATSPELEVVDIVKHITALIFNEIKQTWAHQDIKCASYKNEVKRRFTYFMSREFGLTWQSDKRQMSNHLTTVFARLNKKIRLYQKNLRLREWRDTEEALAEFAQADLERDFLSMLVEINQDICPIDGYPRLHASEDD